jgi:hypothetical protein
VILPYPYDPVTQDLWLYEPVTISWTDPAPGSATIKRPYAWNPNSPLYGYRKSLMGMTARPRQLGNLAPLIEPPYTLINDPNDPVNQPVYYNSFPYQEWVISKRFMTVCSHCYGTFSDRNPLKTFVGVGALGHYQLNSYLHAVMTQSFRWIDENNNLIQQLDPTQLMAPYETDLTNYPGMVNNSDTALCESYEDLLAPTVKYVDMRSLPTGTNGWLLDSNHKILRAQFNAEWVDSRELSSGDYTVLNPDGTVAPYPTPQFTGDSSTTLWVELKPPTKKSAGDGVLARATWGISSSSWIVRDAAGVIANEAPLAPNNDLWNYMAFRGYPLDEVGLVPRRWRAATQAVEQQILDAVEGISLE